MKKKKQEISAFKIGKKLKRKLNDINNKKTQKKLINNTICDNGLTQIINKSKN